MPQLPKDITGGVIDGAWIRSLLNYLRAITPMPGAAGGILVKQGPSGTTFQLLSGAAGGPIFDAVVPRWALTGVIESGPVAKIYVSPGMVNNAIPTIDVSGTPTSIASIPVPGLVVTGSSGQVYLKASVDAAGSITTLVIESASSVPADTSMEKHKLIGTWTASGGAFTSVISILNENQTLFICNGTAVWEA